jgi:hypothetical protein
VCPDEHPVGVRAGSAYPPGHPDAPQFDDGPERCFRSIDQANAAGFPRTAEPKGAAIVHDIYLVRTDGRMIEDCRMAAREIMRPVACPGMLPSGGSLIPTIEGDAALFEGGFPIPPGHDPESETHLWVVTAPSQDRDSQRCTDVLSRRRARVRGRPATWISCGEGAELHGGHVILRWIEQGAAYAVSLHGVTETNRRIVRVIADSARLVDADAGGST